MIVNIPNMIIVLHEKESGMSSFTKSKPKKFNGGPGNAGIIQPAIPSTDKSKAEIKTMVSIFSYPF